DSQTVAPDAASRATTTSRGPSRYSVYSVTPSVTMAEKPSPSGLRHKRRGPSAGHAEARSRAARTKLRVGPPHCGQSFDGLPGTADGTATTSHATRAT